MIKKIYHFWIKFGEVLSWIWTRVILTIVYFVVLGPISVIMKIFGKNPLNFKFEKNTYWLPRQNEELKEEDYYHQF